MYFIINQCLNRTKYNSSCLLVQFILCFMFLHKRCLRSVMACKETSLIIIKILNYGRTGKKSNSGSTETALELLRCNFK